MRQPTDYYAVLGVGRDADDATIKSAYRRAAMRWHPDRNPGNAEAEHRFKAASEAYQVLSDPERRRIYDRFGADGLAASHGAAGPDPFSDIFDNIFGEFMGRRPGRPGPRRGADLRYDLEISLEEAFTGADREISLDVAQICEACGGSGARPGASVQTCSTCGGRGQVRMQNGLFVIERTCPSCHGSGVMVADPCPACHGEGRVERRRTLGFRVPPGVDEGTRIRLAGEGEAGPRGGQAGDLYVFIHLAPHPLWRRDGTTLFAQVPMSFVDAALGGEVTLPGLDGEEVEVKVPPGTQSGRQFRLRGRGMPVLQGSGRGDCVVQVDLETPTRLTQRQRQLLEEFRGDGGTSCPRSRSFLDRLKGAIETLTE